MREPERLKLALLPTPFYRLERTSELLGVEVWVKRDDLTGTAETGNKIRKLEYLVAEAFAQGADTLITCGGEQSNHSRATAVVARRLGMDVHLVLRRTGEGPTGNWLLDLILGATFRWVTPEEYERRDEILAEEAEALRLSGKRPYVIPEGGSNALGIWGYVNAAREFSAQIKEAGFEPDFVVVPSGSGGTYAGLWIGFKVFGVGAKLLGITAGPKPQEQREHIQKITSDFAERFGLEQTLDPAEIDLVDGFWGRGYGIIDEDVASFIADFARREGIILDPTYTGKAFRAAFELVKSGEIPQGSTLVLWHTGGIFGIFPKGQFFREMYFSGERVK